MLSSLITYACLLGIVCSPWYGAIYLVWDFKWSFKHTNSSNLDHTSHVRSDRGIFCIVAQPMSKCPLSFVTVVDGSCRSNGSMLATVVEDNRIYFFSFGTLGHVSTHVSIRCLTPNIQVPQTTFVAFIGHWHGRLFCFVRLLCLIINIQGDWFSACKRS